MAKPSGKRNESGTAASAQPLQMKSLLKELAGEDLGLRMPIIEAAVAGSELSFKPSDPELRARAAKAWATIRPIMAHHLIDEDTVILPWAQALSTLPPEVLKRTRKEHQELRGTGSLLSQVSFEHSSDEVVARAGKVLCVLAALLDDVIAGEQRDVFPMLRRALFATAGPHLGKRG